MDSYSKSNEKWKSQLLIIIAADRWAREVINSDRPLTKAEENLLNVVNAYYGRSVQKVKIPPRDSIPKPPPLPTDIQYGETERPTLRYSDRPTVPTPPGGFAVYKEKK